MTPTLPARFSRPSGSSRNRAAVTRIAPSSGNSAPSATWTNRSVVILPCLTSGIDPLLEWLDTEALHRIHEQLFGAVAQREIGFDNVFDHVGDFRIGYSRADQRPHLRAFVG